jgi:N-acetylneuraminic acid mutarotase
VSGRPPEARKNFDWVRVREYLFIHGGRNDEMRPWVLRTLSVLNLKTMSWLTLKGDKPSYRHSHLLMASSEDEIVILGGKNMEGLCK